ncbi:hypothetical protein [uncultured Psychroserpens sp.]|uniref:hypothetical protein n=1 Tax=uncultured Psychroserpens sp. TaxID=255436 RepID=UPI0026026738|nr:hypothetical protein [uncultured Psychroserpens sp.]
MKTYIALLFTFQLLFSCGIDRSKAEPLNWNYENGSLRIENDTIYNDRIPVAIKVSEIQRFDNSRVLIIKKIDNNDTDKDHAK